MLLIGGYVASFADQAVMHPDAACRGGAAGLSAARAGPLRPQPDAGRGRDGHFEVEARIEGRHIDFIVDTGASLVIMRESDAAQIGIRPMRSDYTATVSTANGKIKAAPAKLDRIEVGGITVYDVPALVLPDEALWKNLLGMSFLSRLKRYEYANGRMVLEQ